jgi:hypothetical protein
MVARGAEVVLGVVTDSLIGSLFVADTVANYFAL